MECMEILRFMFFVHCLGSFLKQEQVVHIVTKRVIFCRYCSHDIIQDAALTVLHNLGSSCCPLYLFQKQLPCTTLGALHVCNSGNYIGRGNNIFSQVSV